MILAVLLLGFPFCAMIICVVIAFVRIWRRATQPPPQPRDLDACEIHTFALELKFCDDPIGVLKAERRS